MTSPAAYHQKAARFFSAQPFYWREAALCAPAIPLLLIGGLVIGQVGYAAVAAGAAFSVGFGAARDLRGWRWAVMIGAMVGNTLAAFIGCLAGQWPPALMLVAGIFAATCAVISLIDEDVWWITLQMVIALLVGGYYSGPLHAAALRGEAVLAGGAAQVVIVVALALLFPQAAKRRPPAPRRAKATMRLIVGHAVRAAICVVASLALAQTLKLANWYWAPMTAMLVLKPGLSETSTRGIARVTGTLVGCALATVLAATIGLSHPLLVAMVAMSATAAFALQKAHYAILTSAVTATVVLLLALARGDGVIINAEHRLIATILGGAIALVGARIVPHRPRATVGAADRVGAA